MPRKKKANIAPEFIGEHYLYKDKIYTLDDCGTEPLALMRCVEDNGELKQLPISEFKDFVRLKPVSPLPREKRKYTRHEKPERLNILHIEDGGVPPDSPNSHGITSPEAIKLVQPKSPKFDVTKWHLGTPHPQDKDQTCRSVYGKTIGHGPTQRFATIDLFVTLGLPTEGEELKNFLDTIPDCPEKTTLVNVLGE